MARTRTHSRAPLVKLVSTADDFVTLFTFTQLVNVTGSGLVSTS